MEKASPQQEEQVHNEMLWFESDFEFTDQCEKQTNKQTKNRLAGEIGA